MKGELCIFQTWLPLMRLRRLVEFAAAACHGSAAAQLLLSAPLPRIPAFGGGSHPVVGKVDSVVLCTCPCWT